nr:MAG TPA: pentapeptide repeat protein [Caudoviricetes sp.]
MDGRKDKAMEGGKIIMEKKKFDREEAINLIARGRMDRLLDFDLHKADLRGADLRKADLNGANLCEANLQRANLCEADLRGANIDYACWPLWCGSLGVKVDVRIARQLAYHLCALDCDDPEYIKARNTILDFANQFHRVQECGILELIEQGVSS